METQNPDPSLPTPVLPFGMTPEFQQQLLQTNSEAVESEKLSAQKYVSRFLNKNRAWLLYSHPGSLDKPSLACGADNDQLIFFSGFQDVCDFYNRHSDIPANAEALQVAMEILELALFQEEFNRNGQGRGYRVVSTPSEIPNPDSDLPKNIQPPVSHKTPEGSLAEIWYWGSHNAELHKFSLELERGKIKNCHDQLVGKVGSPVKLTYE